MNDSAPLSSGLPHARADVRTLVASRIREVANAGMGDPDILAFWFGEPDEVTPEYIRDAALASLAAGETFYSPNFGIPELRDAIAAYVTRLHKDVPASRVAVTASGMSALMLAVQALVGAGDRVVCVTPLWPNLTEIPRVLGAEVIRVALDFDRRGWILDVDRLLAALTPGTRAAMINSPNNPLRRRAAGWCARNGLPEEALEYSIAAGDVEAVARLVGGLAVPAYRQGRVATLQRWFRWLEDRGRIEGHPMVAVLASMLSAMTGRPVEAERWADAVDRWQYADTARPEDAPVEAWAAVVRALLCRRGVEQMRADADEAARNARSSWAS